MNQKPINTPILVTKNLRLRRNKRIVLENISLALHPCELCAIVGPNGTGKSTLLLALAGLLNVEHGEGEIFLEDKLLPEYTKQKISRQIAFLPARTSLPFPLSVQELILQAEPSQADYMEALAIMELQNLEHTPITNLSSGEARRAWIAMTLSRNTPIVLLDEPLAGLDPRYQLRLLDALQMRASAGACVVFIAHDLPYASRANRVIALHNKNVFADGSPQIVLQPSVLRELYGVEAWVTTEPSSGAVVPLATRVV